MRKLGRKQIKQKTSKLKVNRESKVGNIFRLKNNKIGWKYGVIFTVIFILFGLSTGIVAKSINSVNGDVAALERRGDRAITITEISSQIRAKAIIANEFIQFGSQTNIEEFATKQEEIDQLFDSVRDQLDTDIQLNLFSEVEERDEELNQLFSNEVVNSYDKENKSLVFFSNQFNG